AVNCQIRGVVVVRVDGEQGLDLAGSAFDELSNLIAVRNAVAVSILQVGEWPRRTGTSDVRDKHGLGSFDLLLERDENTGCRPSRGNTGHQDCKCQELFHSPLTPKLSRAAARSRTHGKLFMPCGWRSDAISA